MEKVIMKALNELIEKTGSTNPLILLQALGVDLVYTDGLPDWMEAWADGNMAPAGLAGFIFFNIALKAQPLLHLVAARELVKLLSGCYNDPAFFQSADKRQQVENLADGIAKELVSKMDHREKDPEIMTLKRPAAIPAVVK